MPNKGRRDTMNQAFNDLISQAQVFQSYLKFYFGSSIRLTVTFCSLLIFQCNSIKVWAQDIGFSFMLAYLFVVFLTWFCIEIVEKLTRSGMLISGWNLWLTSLMAIGIGILSVRFQLDSLVLLVGIAALTTVLVTQLLHSDLNLPVPLGYIVVYIAIIVLISTTITLVFFSFSFLIVMASGLTVVVFSLILFIAMINDVYSIGSARKR